MSSINPTLTSQGALNKKTGQVEKQTLEIANAEAQIEATKKAQQEYEKTLEIQKKQMLDIILNAESDDSDSEI